jgi:hypothetical protein
MEDIEILVDHFYVALFAEGGPEVVQSFDLLRLIYAKEQCQALLSMVFFVQRDHLLLLALPPLPRRFSLLLGPTTLQQRV